AAKAEALAVRFASRGSIAAVAPTALSGRDFDVVVNATSAGLTGDVTLPWPSGLFRPHAFAYDMIYADAPTTFLRWANAQGVRRASPSSCGTPGTSCGGAITRSARPRS